MTRPGRRCIVAAVACVTVLIAAPVAHAEFLGTDAFDELTGMGDGSSLMDRYPISAYQLDYHIDTTDFGGVPDPTSWPAVIAQFFAQLIWGATALCMWVVLKFLTWTLSVDFLSGPDGALRPVGDATEGLYDTLLGANVIGAALSLAGLWGLAYLVQRKHQQMVSGLLMTLVFGTIAVFILIQPARLAGQALSYTNPLKAAVLAGDGGGSSSASNRLFEAHLLKPWVIVQFGKLKHCVDWGDVNDDGYPRPVPPDSPARDVCRDHLRVGPDGYGGYAPRFLRQPFDSNQRQAEYKALKDGEPPNNSPQFAGYALDKADSPAADMMQQGGSIQRLLLTLVVAVSMWGTILLYGWLAVAALLVTCALLAFLASAAVAAVAAMFPGAGHRIFQSWLKNFGLLWLAPVAIAVAVAVVSTVSVAFMNWSGARGPLLAVVLNGVFSWGAFKSRHRLIRGISGAVAAKAPSKASEQTVNVAQRGAAVVAAPAAAAWGAVKPGRNNEKETDRMTEKEKETARESTVREEHHHHASENGKTPDRPPPSREKVREPDATPRVQYGPDRSPPAGQDPPDRRPVPAAPAARQEPPDRRPVPAAPPARQGRREWSRGPQ